MTTPEFIPLSVPVLRGNEWKYVKDCLDTGWVSSVGSYVDRFEKEVAGYVGTSRAVAVVNGTAALHTALLVAGIGRGDLVLVSTLTFIAPANAIRYVGATPVFIDSDPATWQMDPGAVRAFLDEECERRDGVLVHRATGDRVRAIVPVHVMGHPVDMDSILAIAREHGLLVIEDASESLGAHYKGRRVGAFGDLACFSFNGNKTITTGGGGMITTDRADLADRAKHLTTQAKQDPIEYVHDAIGYNYRLTNLAAALGCAQLEELDDHIAAKRHIAARYASALADVPGITLMPRAPWADPIFWMYTIIVDEARYGMGSRELMRRLGAARIQARPLWQPIHASPAHADLPKRSCPVADRLYREAMSLPSSPDLTDAQVDRVVSIVRG